jgi:hypothetical protein
MMQALHTFVGEPLRHRRFDLAWYRVSQLLHERTNGAFDKAYMRLAKVLRRKVALPESTQMSALEVLEVSAKLRKDGYLILPFRLSVEEIDALTAFAFTNPAHGVDLAKSISVTPGSLTTGEPRLSWWMHDLARLPVIQRLIADGPYCAIAQEYLGCRPVLAHISLWLDAPYVGHFDPYAYHYDNEGPGFLKFFFFLTEVSDGTGSHRFISGTQQHSKPKRFARATLYKEEDLFSWYSRDCEITVRGPAGTILAEDTAGFHRGSTIERDYRLLLQVEFSALDVPTEQELARKLIPASVPDLHPGVASIARKFFVPAAGR